MMNHEHDTQHAARRVLRGVIGIIEAGERFLMIRRAPGVTKAGYWCFPGGHLEAGETSRRAIRRELAEELGIDAIPFERVGSVRTSDSQYVLAVWRVRHASGELRIAKEEVAEVGWFTATQIRAITPNLQSNLRVLEMLGV